MAAITVESMKAYNFLSLAWQGTENQSEIWNFENGFEKALLVPFDAKFITALISEFRLNSEVGDFLAIGTTDLLGNLPLNSV